MQAGQVNVLFLFLVVWASDIGAYMAGRMFGGPKLAPAVSPNKTWSGAVGGLFAAMLVGVATATLLAPGGASRAAAVAAMLGVMAQAGDLLESWIKRRFDVKDTSEPDPRPWRVAGPARWRDCGCAGRGAAGVCAGPGAAVVAMIRSVSILGSTGSVGRSTVALLDEAAAGRLPGRGAGRRIATSHGWRTRRGGWARGWPWSPIRLPTGRCATRWPAPASRSRRVRTR